MARMTVEEIYRGEKYGVMGAATADYLMNGVRRNTTSVLGLKCYLLSTH